MVTFTISMTFPCNALSIQRDNVENLVKENHSGVSAFGSSYVEGIININDVSLEKIHIYDDTYGGKPVSRSMDSSRKKLESVSTVAAIDTAESSINTENQNEIKAPQPTIVESEPQSIIREVALQNNCTQSDIDLLMTIADKESSFQSDAVNSSGDCVGLFQLDSNKGSMSQRLDPRYNTNKAIEYMRARYGSIEGAYNFRLVNHWY